MNIPTAAHQEKLPSALLAACCPGSDSQEQPEHVKLLTQLPLSNVTPPFPPPSITDLQWLRPAEWRQSLGANGVKGGQLAAAQGTPGRGWWDIINKGPRSPNPCFVVYPQSPPPKNEWFNDQQFSFRRKRKLKNTSDGKHSISMLTAHAPTSAHGRGARIGSEWELCKTVKLGPTCLLSNQGHRSKTEGGLF